MTARSLKVRSIALGGKRADALDRRLDELSEESDSDDSFEGLPKMEVEEKAPTNEDEVVRKKRTKAVQKLDVERHLKNPEIGLAALYKSMMTFDAKPSKSTRENLGNLLERYEDWGHKMFPRERDFENLVVKLDRLKKDEVRGVLQDLRDEEYDRFIIERDGPRKAARKLRKRKNVDLEHETAMVVENANAGLTTQQRIEKNRQDALEKRKKRAMAKQLQEQAKRDEIAKEKEKASTDLDEAAIAAEIEAEFMAEMEEIDEDELAMADEMMDAPPSQRAVSRPQNTEPPSPSLDGPTQLVGDSQRPRPSLDGPTQLVGESQRPSPSLDGPTQLVGDSQRPSASLDGSTQLVGDSQRPSVSLDSPTQLVGESQRPSPSPSLDGPTQLVVSSSPHFTEEKNTTNEERPFPIAFETQQTPQKDCLGKLSNT